MKLDDLRTELSRRLPSEVDLEGYFDEETQIRYMGKAKLQDDGRYRVLADVQGKLCIVEVVITPLETLQ